MTDFESQIIEKLLETQKEVLGKLGGVEALLKNGLTHKVDQIEKWVIGHPQTCPFEKRKDTFIMPLSVAVLTAICLWVLDIVFKGS